MPYNIYKKFEAEIYEIEKILSINENLRNSQNTSVDSVYWRTYDYCGALVRLYASFERFVIDILQKWLDTMVSINLAKLCDSSKMLDKYRYGVGEILKRASENRFAGVNQVALIEELHLFQNSGSKSIKIDPFFATLPNLRYEDLVNLLEVLEVDEAAGWLRTYKSLSDHCTNNSTTIHSYLKDIVIRRNEAAHGNQLPQDVLSISVMKDASFFLLQLCKALTELIATQIIQASPQNTFITIGKVEEVFSKAGACIIKLDKGLGIWKGMNVIIQSKSRCYLDKIGSIQINGLNAHGWYSDDKSIELGLTLNVLPTKGALIYQVNQVLKP